MGKLGLSENEWYIMQVLWEKSPLTLREICNALKDEKGWTKHAVTSFLKRMEIKGAIFVHDGEKVKEYSPVWNQEETIQEETQSVLQRVFKGNLLLMVSNAVNQQELSEAELEELRKILETK